MGSRPVCPASYCAEHNTNVAMKKTPADEFFCYALSATLLYVRGMLDIIQKRGSREKMQNKKPVSLMYTFLQI
jgi:hypothetical protein